MKTSSPVPDAIPATPMPSPKQVACNVLSRLPDDCSFADIRQEMEWVEVIHERIENAMSKPESGLSTSELEARLLSPVAAAS